MALTAADVKFWKSLEGKIPTIYHLLQIGAANWYGDLDPKAVGLTPNPDDPWDSFRMALDYYETVLNPRFTHAIDLHGPPDSIQHDLNTPWSGASVQYDLLINSGTAEHIWNQHQFWQTCHDHTAAGGWMMHALPLWGWLDHGFYNFHPTFVVDLAHANGYKIVKWAYTELATGRYEVVTEPESFHRIKQTPHAESAMMYVLFEKGGLTAFAMPRQGVYSERVTPTMMANWRERR